MREPGKKAFLDSGVVIVSVSEPKHVVHPTWHWPWRSQEKLGFMRQAYDSVLAHDGPKFEFRDAGSLDWSQVNFGPWASGSKIH